jgi:predicted permease
MSMIGTLWRELRFAARSMSRAKTASAAVIVTLAIGIGASTTIFSIVNGVLLKPFDYPDVDELVALRYSAPGFDEPEMPSAPFLHFANQDAETFTASGLWATRAAAVTGSSEPERVQALNVTAQVLPLLGVNPMLGRVFSEADDSPEAPLTVVLTYGYWQRQFGGDVDIIGQSLTLDGQVHEIIGVMPRGFRFLDERAELFRPFQFDRSQTFLGLFGFGGIARLEPGVTLETASTEAARLIQVAIDSFPPFPGASREQFREVGLAPNFRTLRHEVVGDVSSTLWVLMGTIGIVLLIACANVANLFLIRAENRFGELAVRSALGAGRLRLARPLVVESLLLGIVGGLAGLGLAYVALDFVLANGPANLPRVDEIEIDGVVLLFASTISIVAGVGFGSMPALRHSLPRLTLALRSAGRGSTPSREGQRVRAGLVAFQVALALLLMIGSGLMFRTYRALSDVEPGFVEPAQVQTFRLNVLEGEIPDSEQALRVMRDVLDETASIPGVESASFVSAMPLEGLQTSEGMYVEGATYAQNEFPPSRRLKFVSSGFFESLGTPLIAGRDLEWIDYDDRRRVAIVSESLATEEWGGAEAAIGKRVRVTVNDPWREVVGVVGDVHEDGLNRPAPTIAYFPILMEEFWNAPAFIWRTVSFAIRTPRAGTEALSSEIRAAIRRINGNLPIVELRTLGDLYDRSLARTSFTMLLLGVAGVMALTLSLVGVYAVIAYAISQRTREIGVRLAFGATPVGVQFLFTRQALNVVMVGVAVGLAAAAGLTRLMESQLFGVAPLDPWTFVAAPAVLLPMAFLGSLLPARRASRVDPIECLRDD